METIDRTMDTHICAFHPMLSDLSPADAALSTHSYPIFVCFKVNAPAKSAKGAVRESSKEPGSLVFGTELAFLTLALKAQWENSRPIAFSSSICFGMICRSHFFSAIRFFCALLIFSCVELIC